LLSDLLQAAQLRLKSAEANSRDRQQAEESLGRLLAQESESSEQLQRVRGELAEWQTQWIAALQSLELDREITPDQALAFVKTQFELIDHQIQADQLRKRVSEIDAFARTFCDEVKAVSNDVAPEIADSDINKIVSELQSRLTISLRDQTRANELASQESRHRRQLEHATAALRQSREQLTALCELAGVAAPLDDASPDQLDEILRKLAISAERSRQRTDCEESLEKTRSMLHELASQETLDSFLVQIQQQSKESIAEHSQELEREIGRVKGERDAVSGQVADFDASLRQMTGSDEAAAAKETLLQIQAEIRSDAEHYSRLKLASSVLHSAIERYRERTRGPVLAIASELFREMTLGSFDGLRVDDDDQNKPVLVGLRDGGRQAIPVTGMSEGTCDQLYLALRLASLQLESEPRNQLPFIVDDILIQFDDCTIHRLEQ
jgi:uncharacterized protein YhaN